MRLIPMLLLLTACTPAPIPEAGIVYRTTQGGPALTTTLSIWTANKAELINVITNTAAGGIEGGFKWQLSPNGNNLQMELTGRNDRVQVPPRGVMQLWVDGQEAFYGIVPDPPPRNESEARTMQVLGGQEALRKALMDSRVYLDQGVYDIVRDFLQRLCPPALMYSGALIGDGSGTDHGPTLSTFYSPTSDLVTVLDSLAKSAATSWGVDTGGRVFFGRPAPAALAVGYAGQGWKALPIQGREAVTRAVLRIVSAPVLPDGGTARWAYGLPQTVTSAAESPTHEQYRAEAAFGGPEGVALIRPVVPLGTSSISDFDGSATLDDDPASATTVTLSPTTRILALDAPSGRTVGVEFDYAWPTSENTSAYKWRFYLDAVGAIAEGSLPPSGTSRTVRVILPPDSATGNIWEGLLSIGAESVDTPTPAVPLTVSRVRFLQVDEEVAQRVAESYLQPPFAAPAEILLKELIPPTPDIEVTGSPSGDVSGPTMLWEYQHDDQDVRTTRIRIGATGADPTVRALKFGVRGP